MTGDGRKCQVNLALRGRAGRAAGRAAAPAGTRHQPPGTWPGPAGFYGTGRPPAEGRSRSRRGRPATPEDPPTWSAWQLLAPHAAVVLNSLSALPDSSDETIGAAADAAYMAARYRASQGSYAAVAAEYGEVFTARLRDLVPDHPSTLATRHEIARMIGAGGLYRGGGRVPRCPQPPGSGSSAPTTRTRAEPPGRSTFLRKGKLDRPSPMKRALDMRTRRVPCFVDGHL